MHSFNDVSGFLCVFLESYIDGYNAWRVYLARIFCDLIYVTCNHKLGDYHRKTAQDYYSHVSCTLVLYQHPNSPNSR